jgi:hypothetical protein
MHYHGQTERPPYGGQEGLEGTTKAVFLGAHSATEAGSEDGPEVNHGILKVLQEGL